MQCFGVIKMATLLRGKLKGQEVELCQWCNDWFSVSMPDGKPKILRPDQLQFTKEEMLEIKSSKGIGTMFMQYQPTWDNRLVKRKGRGRYVG